MTRHHRSRRRANHGQHLSLWLLAVAVVAGGGWSVALLGDDTATVELRSLPEFELQSEAGRPSTAEGQIPAGGAPPAAEVAADTAPPDDPDLERRIAEDVAAYVNSERRARSLPLLDLVTDEHARTANEARLRDQEPDGDVLGAYAGGVRVEELHVRLGTGTRSGEAVAGWLATEEGEVLLDGDASSIAVAAACQPGERGGDLVLTVHVVRAGPAAGGDVPVAADRPGAGRGEKCQFADLATGPPPNDSVVVPAALAAAGAVALALVVLEIQRRRQRLGFTAPPAPLDPDADTPPAD